MRSMSLVFAFLLAAAARPALAQDVPASADPTGVDDDTTQGGGPSAPMGEEIRERVEGGQIITEYRRFGQLYMLKVKPKGGAPLYFVDQYGDGQLNTRPADSIENDVNLPKWRIGKF